MIEIKDLVVEIKKKKILDTISLVTNSSGLFFILGQNGSGKSTLLKSIAGAISLSSGEIRLFGKNRDSFSTLEIQKLLAYMPQNSIAPRVTVFDAILLNLIQSSFYSKKESLSRVAHQIEYFNLEHLSQRYCNELSGGELQRVLLAMILINSPKILLLDEPTNHLDIKYKHSIIKLIKELSKEMLILMVTHEIDLALSYADSVFILKDGKIISNELNEATIKEAFEIDAKIVKFKEREFLVF